MKSTTRKPSPSLIIIPATLCHFTTLGGLMGILGKNAIWASNVSFLNDKKELKHGIDAAVKVLEKHPKMRGNKRLFSSIVEEIKSYKLPDTYAACFCKKDDILSQWRGYGGRQQGVCISFRGKTLREVLRPYRIRPMEVIYDKEKTTSRLRRVIDNAINEDFEDLLGDGSPNELKFRILKTVSRLAPRFKDSGFSEEDEWRFVIQSDDLSSVSFRENAGVLVPYIEMTVENERLPINKITVGPGNHQEMAAKGIELLLKKYEYRNVEIAFSDVPYRT